MFRVFPRWLKHFEVDPWEYQNNALRFQSGPATTKRMHTHTLLHEIK